MLNLDDKRLYELQGQMTDVEFAKKIGISRSQLWRIRTRKSAPGAEFFTKFKRAFPTESIDDYFFSQERSVEGTPQT